MLLYLNIFFNDINSQKKHFSTQQKEFFFSDQANDYDDVASLTEC